MATEELQLAPGSIAELAEGLRGALVTPDDPDYDAARAIWNGAHDCRPALIVRGTGVADVMRAVEFARSQDLEVAVRGGSHSIPGFSTCDGGIVIDLGAMQGVRVDPQAGTARAQGGVQWGQFDHETQAFGLAVTGGLVSTTGLGGFTLGGGIGWLVRKYGLGANNVVAIEVVTADGDRISAFAYRSPSSTPGRKPSARYIGLLLDGARENGLPEEYIRILEAFELAIDERESSETGI
jgi:FAD/FMN-containing dehydrogenase